MGIMSLSCSDPHYDSIVHLPCRPGAPDLGSSLLQFSGLQPHGVLKYTAQSPAPQAPCSLPTDHSSFWSHPSVIAPGNPHQKRELTPKLTSSDNPTMESMRLGLQAPSWPTDYPGQTRSNHWVPSPPYVHGSEHQERQAGGWKHGQQSCCFVHHPLCALHCQQVLPPLQTVRSPSPHIQGEPLVPGPSSTPCRDLPPRSQGE